MLNIILFTLMAITFLGGIIVLFFPFGKEKVAAPTTTIPTYNSYVASLEAIREQARIASAEDVHIFVMWFRGFQGYRSDIPASTRYVHMMEWRDLVDELYWELPSELAPLWDELVHRNSGGAFSEGFK